MIFDSFPSTLIDFKDNQHLINMAKTHPSVIAIGKNKGHLTTAFKSSKKGSKQS